MKTKLFSPLKLRGLTFKNRVFVSPMCQYSCAGDGLPTDWHLVHLGSRATGGAALVIVEASGVAPEGRISADDSGIWSERHAEAFKRITAFIESQGAVPGIQIAHAGRKASTAAPWNNEGAPVLPEKGGWRPLAPSPIAFAPGHCVPEELSKDGIETLFRQFVDAAGFSLKAGFKVLEIHMAHGYMLHEFLSPLSNKRADQYGGSFENRARLPLRIAKAVRELWPAELPVFVRISASDWVEGGWGLQESIAFSKELKKLGVDLVDCSSGGMVPDAKIPVAFGFQTPFAAAIRREAGIATGTVGMITSPQQAEQILVCEEADAVLLGREELRDPYWPLHAASSLGDDIQWPKQYERAKR